MGLFKEFMSKNEGIGSWLDKKIFGDTEPEYDNSPAEEAYWEPGAVYAGFKDIFVDPNGKSYFVTVKNPNIMDRVSSLAMKELSHLALKSRERTVKIPKVMNIQGLTIVGMVYKMPDTGDNTRDPNNPDSGRAAIGIKMTSVEDPKQAQLAAQLLDKMPWPKNYNYRQAINDDNLRIDLNQPIAKPQRPQQPVARPTPAPTPAQPTARAVATAKSPMAPTANQQRKCPSCGRPLPAGTNHCMICGN